VGVVAYASFGPTPIMAIMTSFYKLFTLMSENNQQEVKE